MAVEKVAYARAGLIGNPSDGYFGKTISVTIRDFSAKVTLLPSVKLEIVPSLQDRLKYNSIHHLVRDVEDNGYYGGIRLMKAAVRKFAAYCTAHNYPLHKENFSLRYRSTIPRRVGLAGSSALVTATVRSLMEFYDIDIAKPLQANLILSIENEELGISAGLQDRVIQVYENCVFMDFEEEGMKKRGYGIYDQLDPSLLPPLFIAYLSELAEGSEVFHNNIRERWHNGDAEIHQAMKDFGSYAQQSKELLLAGRGNEIGALLDQNFDRRRSIFQISEENIRLVERARSVGAHCKFAGSGGAIVGVYADEAMYAALEEVYEGTGTKILKPQISAGVEAAR